MMVHHNLHIRQQLYCDRFSEHVVDYAIEWERVIVARVSTSLSHAERLRRNLDHYNDKVERLKMEKSKMISQGKSPDIKFTDKLARNTAKLSTSQQTYESYASDLTILIQEVTTRSWKDLHPILLKLTQFDSTLAGDETKLLKNLDVVSNNLKKIANRYGLKADSRLAELETLGSKLIIQGDGDKMLFEARQSSSSHFNSRSQSRSSSREVRSSSRSSSRESDAVVQEVVKSMVSKTSTNNSSALTPKIAHLAKPRTKQNSTLSEMDKALDELVNSPKGGSRMKKLEFTGKPKQINVQSASKSGSDENPLSSRSRNKSSPRKRPSPRKSRPESRNSSSPFDGLEGGPSNNNNKYEMKRLTMAPNPNGRAHTPTRDDAFRKKWSDELVVSVEKREEPKSWYNFF